MSEAGTRDASYESAGKYVVNSSDVLIAVWNGEAAAGQGGTAEIVKYARSIGHPLIWINSESGEVRYEWDKRIVLDSLRSLEDYNTKRLHPRKVRNFSGWRYEDIMTKGRAAGIPEDLLDVGRKALPAHILHYELIGLDASCVRRRLCGYFPDFSRTISTAG
jgi:hypothetical protein